LHAHAGALRVPQSRSARAALGCSRRAPWSLAHAYLAGHALLEQATTHLIDLNQASGESVSLSEPDGADMVFIARFPSLKRFYIHMPVGRRLPMYCTASGRAYLAALPAAAALRVVRRSELRPLTALTLTDPKQILKRIQAAREAGYALVGPGVLPRRRYHWPPRCSGRTASRSPP